MSGLDCNRRHLLKWHLWIMYLNWKNIYTLWLLNTASICVVTCNNTNPAIRVRTCPILCWCQIWVNRETRQKITHHPFKNRLLPLSSCPLLTSFMPESLEYHFEKYTLRVFLCNCISCVNILVDVRTYIN